MKPLTSFILVLICMQFSAKAISLAEAIRQKQVTAHFTHWDHSKDSVYTSSFYGDCIKVELTNLLNQPLSVELEAGRFLMPDDSNLQRMMVMEPVFASLKAKEKKEYGIKAMCTELHDGGPRTETIFSMGKMAQGNLLKVAKYIADNKYQTEIGQQAVWAISDKADPGAIYSDDTAQTKKLRTFVCGLLNIPVPKMHVNQSDAFEGRFRSIHGTFEYSIHRNKTVKLEVYNEQGQLLKRCVNSEAQEAGDYKYEYNFTIPVNNPTTVDRQVIVKFYLDGVLIANSPHTIPNN